MYYMYKQKDTTPIRHVLNNMYINKKIPHLLDMYYMYKQKDTTPIRHVLHV